MKLLYKGFFNILLNMIVSLEISKVRMAEYYALFRKRGLYRDIVWIVERKVEFTNFWKNNYGRCIISNGHRLYESINGVFRKDYIPDFLFATKIEPFFNPYYYARLYSDKSITEILYSSNKTVVFPKTYLVKSSGIFYDGERRVISKTQANEIFNSMSEVVIKPTVGGNSGKGVLVCKFEDGFDKLNSIDISRYLSNAVDNFIVQEKLNQHELISKIYPHSVNTFRVITYILDGLVNCADLALRIGSGGGNIDNIHAGGLVIGVKSNGSLLKFAYKLGYSDSNVKFSEHPDTGIIFENYFVPGTTKIIECAKELHGLTPHIGMISWDFMISTEENPVLIEANYWGQSVWFTQIVNGKPIFGDHTEEILRKLKK